MKNLLKFLGLSVLVSFIALGCSNTSSDAVSLTPAKKTAMKTITLVATGDEDAISFPIDGVSASIVAGTTDAETLKYYLFYKNEVTGDMIEPEESLTFKASAESPNIGTVPLEIADGYYTFYLYATKDAPGDITEPNVKAKALFLGQTQADLRTSVDTVSFYLTSDTLSGTADIAIGIKTTGWVVPAGYTVTAQITSKTDGSTVQGTGQGASSVMLDGIAGKTGGITIGKDADHPGDDVPAGSEQYTQVGVKAGTYNFEVSFKNSNANPARTYTWSDTIIVSPNNNITKSGTSTIAIPEVIEKVPDAPSDFNAFFLDPDSVDAGYYNVLFAWKADKSINESHFAIELLELTDSAVWAQVKTVPGAKNPAEASETAPGVSADDWNHTTLGTLAANITTLGRDFYGNESQNWVGGSLRKNNNWAIVALPLGKRYLARIAAVNDAGKSRYCYVDFANANVPLDGKPSLDELKVALKNPDLTASPFNKFDADKEKVINRYRLTYNLLGGTVTKSDDSTSTADIVEYRTQNDESNDAAGDPSAATEEDKKGTYVPSKITGNKDVPSADIWNPKYDVKAGSLYTKLEKGGKEWTSWRLNSSSSATLYDSSPKSDPYNPPDYTNDVQSIMGKGYQNLVLYANYSPTTAAVNILDDNIWTIGVNNFVVGDTPAIPSGNGVKAKDGTTDLDKDSLLADSEISLNLQAASSGPILWTVKYTAEQTAANVIWKKMTYTVKKTDESWNKEGPIACTATPDPETDPAVPKKENVGFTATTNLKSCVPGKYAVTFYAYAAHKTLPYTCTIYVHVIER